jgi:acetyl esterase/lipase
MNIRFIVLMGLLISLVSCSVSKISDIDYGSRISGVDENPKLNVFSYHKKQQPSQPVLIFVYGGNWNSGNKEIYNYVGRNFARHNMVVVLPDYTKSPQVSYKEMTTQIATSINWVKEHIADYGGDPDRIYVTGHSAGGHLVALATMNPEYGVPKDAVKGIILNDAAGLDMETFLKNNPPTSSDDYIATWTTDPEAWKEASPINFLTSQTPKIKIYTGEKTFESIIFSNKRFVKELQKFQPEASIQWLDKKHVPMVSQLFWPWSDRYDEMEAFMNIP